MQIFRSMRWLLLTLLLSLIPATSHSQIIISVGFAPPEMPVYEQPFCPQPNLMWMPGYWAYSEDDGDYFWVPGAWVEAPYEGALWTPNYWDWSDGHYNFHQGYWGLHVGYYGGVNYGFGYGGIGFAGGEWRGSFFAYNTAVVHVNETVIHTTYVDRTVVERGIVANPNHVAYNGGPRGIQHTANPEERVAEHDQHAAPSSSQTQHVSAARGDKTSYAKTNGGHPKTLAAEKPLAEQKQAAPAGIKTEPRAESRPAPAVHGEAMPQSHPAPTSNPAPVPAAHPEPAARTAPSPHPAPAARPEPTPHTAPSPHPAPAARPEPTPHPAPREEPKHN
jgi:hypothetical protein